MTISDPCIKNSGTVLIVLAHYMHNESIHKFLKHISMLKFPRNWKWKVAICDNSGDLEDFPDLEIDLTVYRPGENKYYLGGCWFALTKWQEENGNFPDWVIVTNHDLVFESDFFLRLLSMSIDEDIAVVAPDVRILNGVKQNPHILKRPSLISMVMRTMAFRYRPLYRLMNLQYTVKMNFKAIAKKLSLDRFNCLCKVAQASCMPIYSAHGSVLLFRKVFFDRGGNLASKAMMYHEEFLVAERCRRMALRIIMNASLNVVHNENSVIRLVSNNIQYGWMKCLSRVLIDIYRTGEKDIWISSVSKSEHVLK